MQASPDRQPAIALAEDYDRGAERVLTTLGSACEPDADFPSRLEAALRAVLELFAAEPELGRLLTVRPFTAQGEALPSYLRLQRRCADMLRAAARRSPDAYANPPFVEPALIGGICWGISRRLDSDGPKRLPELLPDLMEFLLACYYGPEQATALSRAS